MVQQCTNNHLPRPPVVMQIQLSSPWPQLPLLGELDLDPSWNHLSAGLVDIWSIRGGCGVHLSFCGALLPISHTGVPARGARLSSYSCESLFLHNGGFLPSDLTSFALFFLRYQPWLDKIKFAKLRREYGGFVKVLVGNFQRCNLNSPSNISTNFCSFSFNSHKADLFELDTSNNPERRGMYAHIHGSLQIGNQKIRK